MFLLYMFIIGRNSTHLCLSYLFKYFFFFLSITHQKQRKQAGRKSHYSVSNYLSTLVGDFIRGKKLQEEEREQRQQNESEEIWASLVLFQCADVILPINGRETKDLSLDANLSWDRKTKTTKQSPSPRSRQKRPGPCPCR